MVMRGADDSVALHSCTQQLPRRWLARRFSGSANQCVARLEPAAAAGCPRPKVASAGAATLSVPRGFSGCTPRPGSGLGVVQRGPNRVRRDGGKKKESHA